MSSFQLSLGNSEFADRQKKVFDQLEVLENSRNITTPDNDKRENSKRFKRSGQSQETKHLRGKESIFKKPQKTAPRNYISRMPDYKKNPHKWTKYSLEDVEDVTEESNKKSAMDFLKELANRRKSEQGIVEEELEEIPSKIVFNKHVKRNGEHSEGDILRSDDKPLDSKVSFRNSTLVMPEYNIGDRATKKVKDIKRPKPQKGRELKLDHLAYDDGDDE